MVEEEEVRLDLLRLLEDLRQGGEGDEDPIYLGVMVADLEPHVVPVLREGARCYLLYGLGYLSYACHPAGIVQSRAVELARIARFVSGATRLPLMAVPLFLLVGVASDGWGGVLWALLCLLLTSGLSLAYLAYLTRSGRVRDPRKIPQGERVRPLRVVAGLHAGAWILVTLLGAPEELRAVLLSYALATTAFALLAPFVNLSLHAAGVAGTLICLLLVLGAWGVLFAPVLPLVWWARTVLSRHTLPELALGTLVGGGLTWVSFAVAV